MTVLEQVLEGARLLGAVPSDFEPPDPRDAEEDRLWGLSPPVAPGQLTLDAPGAGVLSPHA